tara:strand:- start:37 stop:420 length:384 start_codon:yes stop_codon:yes gene_type:complete
MKSNIEKVYSKLPQKKHNLKKQKIELNVAFDLAAISSSVDVFRRNIDIDMNELERLIKELDDVKISLEVDIEDLEAETEALENKLINAEDMAKELGVDASAISNFDNAVKTYDIALIQLEKGKNYLK